MRSSSCDKTSKPVRPVAVSAVCSLTDAQINRKANAFVLKLALSTMGLNTSVAASGGLFSRRIAI